MKFEFVLRINTRGVGMEGNATVHATSRKKAEENLLKALGSPTLNRRGDLKIILIEPAHASREGAGK